MYSNLLGTERVRHYRDERSSGSCPCDRDDSAKGVDLRLHGDGERSDGDSNIQTFFKFAATSLLGQPFLEPRVLCGYGGH